MNEEEKKELKRFILDKRQEGKVVVMGLEGPMSMPLEDIIKQPADGLLYDLNRLEETALTFIEDPKWVNDFAVALVIRKLKSNLAQLESKLEILKDLDIRGLKIIATELAKTEPPYKWSSMWRDCGIRQSNIGKQLLRLCAELGDK